MSRLQRQQKVIQACNSCIQRAQCTLPGPHKDKSYSPKIRNLVENISKLTLLEVAEQNELLKVILNEIQDAPIMSMAYAVIIVYFQGYRNLVFKTQHLQTSIDVKIKVFDAGKKIALIKEIKSICGLNLVQHLTIGYCRMYFFGQRVKKMKEALEAVGESVDVEKLSGLMINIDSFLYEV
ncbi:39S ribosomal protein L12, mitochondrial-like [Pecten maximus]|uniref:39S ribosomal protein L12, mitochondrial-like n=1 Tax=Pecten maximus TaxID=6579 RepID=UPI001458DFA3|nr:39S ribosomal protein L12, mitochondrial-like [Pecten maximus]